MSDTLQINLKPIPEEGMKSFRGVKSHFYIVAMTLLVIVAAILGGCNKSTSEEPPLGTGDTLRFVFLADSRGDSLEHPVNYEALNTIIGKIDSLSPRPSFVIFGGDMSYRGYIGTSYTFQAFKDLFASITSKGIPLYTAVGNHELYHEHSDSGFRLVNQQAFQIAFPENPSNGPAGYEHLTYSFTAQGGSCFFAVLDPYYLIHDIKPTGLGGNIDTTQMLWLMAQVAQTSATHKFLFIHTPYYYISDDPEEPSSANASFTALWAFLDASKFDFYACGHSHLFSRRTIVDTIPPNPQTVPQTSAWQNNVVQLLNGTCGAGPDSGPIDPNIQTLWNVHNAKKTYYFSVVDICGGTVKVNSYGGYMGAYSLIDTFTITR